MTALKITSKLLATLVLAALIMAGQSSLAAAKSGVKWDGSFDAPGIWFYWYEPSFYTGYAPKTQDPSRVHMQLSRGNQNRFTLVLGATEIDAYLQDLQGRRDMISTLVDQGIIELTTNLSYDRYAAKLDELGVADALAARAEVSEDEFRAKTIEIMSALNPGRIFKISMPLDGVLAKWHDQISNADLSDKISRLDVANALLPGRINAYELSDEVNAALDRAVAAKGDSTSAGFVEAATEFLTVATNGHYSVVNGAIEALEFTAIYPVGTAQATRKTKYGTLPDFGVTGVWPLVERKNGRGITGMVDYLSSNPGYGFIPMIAYQPAGGIYYNAIHNAGIRTPASTPYLPKEWRKVPGEKNPNKPYKQLWIVSRGPASHGCTRMDSGQMSEFRNSMPSSSDTMVGIPNFRNLPQCHEVFDVDGDGKSEVMGVSYFHAYKSAKHKPAYAYAPNNREDYYDWLYGKNVSYVEDGSAVLAKVPVCRFIGKKKAQEMAVLENIPLYEAPFEPGPIQFYKLLKTSFESRKGMEFNRELRRIGLGYETQRDKLFLK